jgi:Uma2 family endonuclease
MTAKVLVKLPPERSCGELIRGKFFHKPFSDQVHGYIAANILGFLDIHIRKTRVGRVFMTGTGFILARNPDTVRAPDAAFVRAERLVSQPATGFFDGAPDLAVEVISPSETVDAVSLKEIFE